MKFQKATKSQSKARIALIGASGSGKTYSALSIASALGDKIAVIDTERGSASKYADVFNFDTLELASFSPLTYCEAIKAAAAEGYEVLVIDSLSHAWSGKDGALEQVDRAAKRMQSNNTFAAWRDVTPLHNQLVDTILQAPMHIIATMRAKTEYVLETNERGKQTPRKVGLAPVQRDGVEYEFDIVGDIDLEHNLIISKTRCAALDGAMINKPGAPFGATVKAWLTDGAPQQSAPKTEPPTTTETQETKPTLPPQTVGTFGNGVQTPSTKANGNARRPSPISDVQKAKIRELFMQCKNMPAEPRHELNAAIDALFIESFGHGMTEATYEEGARITGFLIGETRKQPA